jgi:hypothetical protein
VGQQGLVAVGEGQPEVLAPTARRLEPSAAQAVGEVRRAWCVPTQSSWMAGLDCRDGAPDDMTLEPSPDHLDLWELGHS